MPPREMYCATCGGDVRFEVPPCQDGHDDCPELACTACGTAVVSAEIVLRVWMRSPGTRVAPQQRRAA